MSSSRHVTASGLLAALLLFAVPRPPLGAETAGGSDAAGDIETLPAVTVSSTAASVADQYQLPQTVQTISAAQAEETVNAADVEDDLKYFPDLFLRKRNYGDNQAVLATRTWGLNSSARSLVYADGVLLTALIANNNSIGAPRWGMVAPEEISDISVVYGPFAAAYPGNSMGAVVEIGTRMPDRLEASLSQDEALQPFSLYRTKSGYLMSQTAATFGDRLGKWSFWVSGDEEHTRSQPLAFVTAAGLPAGTTGGIADWNKLGQVADVLGASSVQESDLQNLKLKAAYDFTPAIRATYTLGLWGDHTAAAAQTYLRDASGAPTFAGVSGFASGTYLWVEEHTMQSLILKSAGAGDLDWQLTGSLYDFDKDTERTPNGTSSAGTTLSQAGKVAVLGGTGWSTVDAKAAWHPDGRNGAQELSFGAHADEYALVNPTYNTDDWQSGRAFGSLASEGNGKTATSALWIQEAWQVAPAWKATIGGRYEWWRAFDGVNVNGAAAVIQPDEASNDFSPKATLAWTVARGWTVTASSGNAHRYPTASELYQLVTTGATFASPNPNLLPEDVWTEELRTERKFDRGFARLTLFEEDTANALVSQYATLVPGSSALYSYTMNVGKIRNRGAEIFLDRDGVVLPGLDLSGSVTYVDSRILADEGQGQFSAAVGKKAPYVPMWRATFLATYRLDRKLAWTVGGRYSGRQYSTVDNTDAYPSAYGGFQEFFVLDTHVNWTFARNWSFSGGADNLLNRKYFLFHIFPERTFVAKLKLAF